MASIRSIQVSGEDPVGVHWALRMIPASAVTLRDAQEDTILHVPAGEDADGKLVEEAIAAPEGSLIAADITGMCSFPFYFHFDARAPLLTAFCDRMQPPHVPQSGGISTFAVVWCYLRRLHRVLGRTCIGRKFAVT